MKEIYEENKGILNLIGSYKSWLKVQPTNDRLVSGGAALELNGRYGATPCMKDDSAWRNLMKVMSSFFFII